ncbi:MAG: hypothetical protein V4618_13430 [Pseudomonadota bacterium]
MTWQLAFVAGCIGAIAFASIKMLDALDRLNKQIENVRYYLGQFDERQQRIEGKLRAIEHHTRRAVAKEYDDDEWLDRQPPG